MTINLNDLDWVIPDGFKERVKRIDDTTYSKEVATVDGMTLTLSYDVGFCEATLLMENSHGRWQGDTSMDGAHPQFDQAFGRLHWRQFLLQWEEEQYEKLEAENEEGWEAMAEIYAEGHPDMP